MLPNRACTDQSLDSILAWMNRSDVASSVDVSIPLALGAGDLSMSAILDLGPNRESVSWYGVNMIPMECNQPRFLRPF
jgi:hypothetical protein